jgi:3-deoxy-D-manno-octulosonate 8-phosphate phosphatase (KDO 8-P phosphatase)
MTTPAELIERAGRVRLVLTDVDGVLTDGTILAGVDDDESRRFNARDGLGIRLGQRAGLTFGIVSGRRSRAVAARAAELDMPEVHQGVIDKVGCLQGILERIAVEADEVCFIGDDLIDLPIMRRVGLSAAPADAVDEVREAAHVVTGAAGGRGAMRELVELLLRSSGKWQEVTQPFFE